MGHGGRPGEVHLDASGGPGRRLSTRLLRPLAPPLVWRGWRNQRPPLDARPRRAHPIGTSRCGCFLARPRPLLAGLGDRLFFEWLKRFLQGNDRISQSLAEVAPTPRTADAFIAAPLTVADNEVLIARVARGVSLPRTLDRLRRVIGQVAYGGALQSPFEPEEGETAPVFNSLLVHTGLSGLEGGRRGDEGSCRSPSGSRTFLEGERSGQAPAPGDGRDRSRRGDPRGRRDTLSPPSREERPRPDKPTGPRPSSLRPASRPRSAWRRSRASGGRFYRGEPPCSGRSKFIYALVGIACLHFLGGQHRRCSTGSGS